MHAFSVHRLGRAISLVLLSGLFIGLAFAPETAKAQYSSNQYVMFGSGSTPDVFVGEPSCQALANNQSNGNCSIPSAPGYNPFGLPNGTFISNGTGSLNVTGTAQFGDLVVGAVSDNPGQVSISGSLTVQSAQVGPGGSSDLIPNNYMNSPAAPGSVNVTGKWYLTNSGQPALQNYGMISVSNGGLVSSSSIYNDGSITVQGGSSLSASSSSIYNEGSITVQNGSSLIAQQYFGSLNLSNSAATFSGFGAQAYVGDSGGTIALSGSTLTSSSGGFTVGPGTLSATAGSKITASGDGFIGPFEGAIGSGSLSLSSGSSAAVTGQLYVGPVLSGEGNGSAVLTGGSTLSANAMQVGQDPTGLGLGTVDITGGSTVNLAGNGIVAASLPTGISTLAVGQPFAAVPPGVISPNEWFDAGPITSPLSILNGGTVEVGSQAASISSGLSIGNDGALALNVTPGQISPDITTAGTLELGGVIQIQTNGEDFAGNTFIPLIASSTVNLTSASATLSFGSTTIDPATGDYDYALSNVQGGGSTNILVPKSIDLVPEEQQVTTGGKTIDVLGLGNFQPTLLQLAQASQDVYSGKTAPLADEVAPGYTFIGDSCGPLGVCGGGLRAAAYESGDQIIVAIRGTLVLSGKDLLADTSFLTGTPSPALQQEFLAAARFLSSIEANYPNATITLTGHSLGGAIAEMLAEYTGLDAVAFNAPKPGALYLQLTPEILGVLPFNFGGTITNYRIYGDQYSLYGQPLAGVTTITLPSTFSNSTIDQDLTSGNFAYVNYDHEISTVVSQVQSYEDNTIQVEPTSGINFTARLTNQYVSTVSSYISPLGVVAAVFALAVTDLQQYVFDPGNGEDFVFTELAGSPKFACYVLPVLPNVSSWDVSVETGTTWSNVQDEMSAVDNCITSGFDGINFEPLDAAGDWIDLTDPFIFDTSFASLGNFAGTLDEIPPSATNSNEVPEPSTVVLLIVPFALFWGIARRRCCN